MQTWKSKIYRVYGASNYVSLAQNGSPFQRSVAYYPLKAFDVYRENFQDRIPHGYPPEALVRPGLVAHIEVTADLNKLTIKVQPVQDPVIVRHAVSFTGYQT